jgi:hypothetical protein
LITRVPRSHRYRLTDTGLHHAMLLSHIHTRLLLPGLAHLTDPDPPEPSILRTTARNYRQALDHSPRKPTSPPEAKLDSILPTSSASAN